MKLQVTALTYRSNWPLWKEVNIKQKEEENKDFKKL
jgi:hypothetical protein